MVSDSCMFILRRSLKPNENGFCSLANLYKEHFSKYKDIENKGLGFYKWTRLSDELMPL